MKTGTKWLAWLGGVRQPFGSRTTLAAATGLVALRGRRGVLLPSLCTLHFCNSTAYLRVSYAWRCPCKSPNLPFPDFCPVLGLVGATIANARLMHVRRRRGMYLQARIRYAPEKDWPGNSGSTSALALLKPVRDAFPGLSWSDLIVLAGSAGLENAGIGAIPFCGGRTDAVDGAGSQNLDPATWAAEAFGATGDAIVKSVALFKQRVATLGLTTRQMVALIGGGLAKANTDRSGFAGTAARTAGISNRYFKMLFAENWQPTTGAGSPGAWKAAGKELYATGVDMLVRADPELAAIAQEYAAEPTLFAADFVEGWTALMNADRFDGPTGNLCARKSTTAAPSTGSPRCVLCTVCASETGVCEYGHRVCGYGYGVFVVNADCVHVVHPLLVLGSWGS